MTEGIRHPFDTPPAEGGAIEVAPGILWLRLPLPMALDHVNIYALDDSLDGGDGWTIIDAGLSSKRSKAMAKSAARVRLKQVRTRPSTTPVSIVRRATPAKCWPIVAPITT